MAFHLRCPYCECVAIVQDGDSLTQTVDFERLVGAPGRGSELLKYRFIVRFIHCPNIECRQVSVRTWLDKRRDSRRAESLFSQQILPASRGRRFDSEIVPGPIIQDYVEATLIEDLSPKAAATLVRRAMQGLLRDYFGASGRTLYDEISSVQNQCEPALWNAMHDLREVGNIGAHHSRSVKTA